MIKTPVEYEDGHIFNIESECVATVAGTFSSFQEPLGKYIATCINSHETLTAQVAELKGEVERLKAHRFAADERLRQFEGFVHLRACRHRCFCDSFAETYPAGEPNE
jgi:hypothetical protein